MKKKVLITGASGFLGKTILNSGADLNEIEFYATTANADRLSVELGENQIKVFDRNFPFTEEFVQEQFACVVNCAYPRNTDGVKVAEGMTYISNLFCRCREARVGSVINISSQSIYDPNRAEPATEDSIIRLITPYAVGKYATELMLNSVCAEIPHTNVRMASLIGSEFNQRIINRFINDALNMRPILVHKTEQRFGFLDVRDAAEGVLALILSDPTKWHTEYNLGNEKAYTVEEIIDCVVQVFEEEGRSVPQIIKENKEGSGSSAVAYQRLHQDTGYEPKINLKQSTIDILHNMCK